ncbi:MAG: phosphoribosylformylglycinamidine synthase subunit PurL [Candidatus Nitrospinota bacterium M3_3B_026]
MLDTNHITLHGLTREEFDLALEILGRPPNIVELGIFSAMWSEHCSYKSSRLSLKRFPTTAPHVIQGPGENAGVVDIGGGLVVVFKMESHNHPSYIEPYQGAATGVGGILRDIFTMGARPVASLNSIRFGAVSHPRTRYLAGGVVAGIAGYGNCVGVPTIGGELVFHESYNGNCLVNAFNLGVAPKDKIFLGKAEGAGNPVMYVGSRTGRDGIHGATMASEEFSEDSEERRPTVQVGDPFTEKLLIEACLELFKSGAVVGIQDMGAAGMTSSAFEMAGRAGTGVEIDLSKVPRREEGMTPYEIMLSESQERMLLVAKKGTEEQVREIFEKWGLSAEVIGQVTDDGMVRLKDNGEVVAEIPAAPLSEKSPVHSRLALPPENLARLRELKTENIPEPENLTGTLKTMLGSPNLCSREWVWRQYDHMVRTDTVQRPGSDAAVIRIKGTKKAVAMSLDCNARYCFLDPREGGRQAVAEAARNVACSGAKPLAITDCLNFGSPEREEVMWRFNQAIEGMAEACEALGTPVVSGNVSFYNQTGDDAVHPTPTVGAVGLLENYDRLVGQFFRKEGDAVILLGETFDEIGGSEYLAVIHGMERGAPPRVNLEKEAALQKLLGALAGKALVRSAHDVSDGGLAVCLAECLFDTNREEEPLGFEVDLETDLRADFALFSESQSRVVLSADPADTAKILETAAGLGVPAKVIGKVTRDIASVMVNGKTVIKATTTEFLKPWRKALPSLMGA